MRVEEIGVLGNDNALLVEGKPVNLTVLGCIAFWKQARVLGIVSVPIKHGADASRQVRVDEKLHESARWILFTASMFRANA